MDFDLRHTTAEYYDRFSGPPGDDVSFYLARLPGTDARVLELGCGTGRVLLPVAERAGFTFGVDLSKAMLERCNQKLEDTGLYPTRAKTLCADICDLDLTTSEPGFDRISAPFRVMQNLETDAQVDALMRVIRRHLRPGGEAVLNTFNPRGGFAALAEFWSSHDGTVPNWTKSLGEDTVTMCDDCTVFGSDPLCVYPKLIYRRYNPSGALIDEAVMQIVMRVWQPDALLALIEAHGFKIKDRFGGYHGERWGQGSELVVAFTAQ